MLSSVSQSVRTHAEAALPGDKTHTFIKLAETLAYCFKRDTVKIYGNVVKATHGETRTETLGSGDGSKTLQQFILKQPPLTFVPASNPSGVDSTLEGLRQRRAMARGRHAGRAGPPRSALRDARPTTKARPPSSSATAGKARGCRPGSRTSGPSIATASARAGNVKAEQISLLSTRPLGVKEVINPLPASGGADRETPRPGAQERAAGRHGARPAGVRAGLRGLRPRLRRHRQGSRGASCPTAAARSST